MSRAAQPAGARREERFALAAAVFLALAFGVTFSWLAVARHHAFQSHAFDLGNMDQAVWNTLHGHWLRFTDMDVGGTVVTDRFAIHFEPLLAALAPLYVLHSGPETLLVVQALVVGAGAIPAYLLGRDLTGHRWLALSLALAWVLHPSVQNMVLDDFHAVALGACFLLWAIYFAFRGHLGRFVLFALLAASTKEEMGLVAGMLGLVLLWRGRRMAGVTMLVAGFLWFAVAAGVIIPHFNPSGRSPYLTRYSYLGHGLTGVLRGALTHPGLVAGTLLSTSRLVYLTDLLHPLGYLPVAALPVFLLALPALLINMLSHDPTMYSGFYQYAADVVPFAVAASAAAWGWMERASRHVSVSTARALALTIAAFLAVASLVDTRQYGFTPLADGYIVPSSGAHQAIEQSVLRLVPPRAVVAAADEVEPHLAERRWVYLLPTVDPRNGPQAQYIALDASVPASPVEPHTLHSVASSALAHGFGIEAARDGVLLLRRGARRTSLGGRFFTFAFSPPGRAATGGARWRNLSLAAFTVHPRSNSVNRSRPAIGVEAYWRIRGRLTSRPRIAVYLSPVYQHAHPAFSSAWARQADSPTIDWLPISRWPAGRTLHTAFVPLVPQPYRSGLVDVAIGVTGLGPARGRPLIPGSDGRLVRLATVSVEG